MKKILASDLDGTLLKDNIIPQNNLNAINNLKESGGMFVIATGRPYNGVSNLIKEYDLEVDYNILLNGALIIDKTENVMLHKTIPFKSVIDIISYVQSSDAKISVETGFKTYTIGDVHPCLPYGEKEVINSIEDIHHEDISLISIYLENTPAKNIDSLCQSINQLFNNDCIAYRNTNFIDVVPLGCSKGGAIEHICTNLNIDSSLIYTIGDSFNDVSMFDITKNSFTFHQCEDTLKSYASTVVHSVSQCIDDYILENKSKKETTKKVKLGIIGSGFIVHNFIEAAKLVDNLELYAFYSRNVDTTLDFKEKYNFKKVYTNLDEMALDKELDAVYIASPNALHHTQSIQFLKNKKHVLCEKAFASNVKEVKEMILTAHDNNVVLMEAMKLTALPNFLQVKNNLHKIGKIRRYFASYCQYSSRYDKFKEGEVLNAFKNELSNGSLMDIGVYCISPLVNLFDKPRNIVCNSYMLHTGVDGQGSAILKYDDMDAVIMYSKIANSHIPSEIQGEKGSIIIDKINAFSNVKIIYNDGSIEDLTLDQKENDMYYEISEFINLILSSDTTAKYSSLNTLENSLSVIETICDIRKKIGLTYPADK